MTLEELKTQMYIHREVASVPRIAQRLGVSRTLVYLVRAGKSKSYPVACEIARSIGRTVDEVFPGQYARRVEECPQPQF